MLDRDTLNAVNLIVTHANCPDGVASALILNDAYNRTVPIKFLAHGTPAYDKLEATPNILFCDITPPRERVQEFVKAGAIVLDHHDKQKDIVAAFGARGVYSAEPGVSGAVLAFREVWSPNYSGFEERRCIPSSEEAIQAHQFAKLAGIRDTWQTQSPDWVNACAQAEALKFYPWDYLFAIESVFSKGYSKLEQLLDIGPVLIDRRMKQAKTEIENAYGFATERGTRVMVVSTIETSDIAEAVGDAAQLVIGFKYNGGPKTSMRLSMRSHTGFDVGEFAVSLGGGGHGPSAGASVPVMGGDLNPYEFLVKLVNDYERGL